MTELEDLFTLFVKLSGVKLACLELPYDFVQDARSEQNFTQSCSCWYCSARDGTVRVELQRGGKEACAARFLFFPIQALAQVRERLSVDLRDPSFTQIQDFSDLSQRQFLVIIEGHNQSLSFRQHLNCRS